MRRLFAVAPLVSLTVPACHKAPAVPALALEQRDLPFDTAAEVRDVYVAIMLLL